MIMHFTNETPDEIQEEHNDLVYSYWLDENPAERVVHDLDWDVYRAIHAAGICRIYACRDGNGLLVGCVFYNVIMHPHHRGYKVAEGDMISVRPSHRGMGVAARLMEYAENLLVADGVREIVHRHKLNYKTTPLYLKLGYEAAETVYRKQVS